MIQPRWESVRVKLEEGEVKAISDKGTRKKGGVEVKQDDER